jgi:hypothetical protein
MQLVPHLMFGLPQVVPQEPPLQAVPGAHTSPSFAPAQSSLAPQNVLLLDGSMQVLPHLICGSWQVS